MSTSVALSVTCTINGRPVNLNAGDLANLTKGGLVFSLTEPIPMGTARQFADWLNTKFGTSIDMSMPAALPAQFAPAYESFINGNVILDTLVINQPASVLQLGMSYRLQEPADLFGGLAFNGIGLVISRQPSSTLAAAAPAAALTITVKRGEGALFGLGSIRVDSEQMLITKNENDTLTVTRGQNSTTAADHKVGAMVTLVLPTA